MKIYHNPRCSKSRETLTLIETEGHSVEVVEYLKATPGKEELKSLLKKLNIPASELVRKKEKIFLANYKGKTLSEDEWVDAMVKHPILIERPIVVKGNKAVIGRPPENVLKLV